MGVPRDLVPPVPNDREIDSSGWMDGLDGSRVKYTVCPVPGLSKVYRNWNIDCSHPECKGFKTNGTTNDAVARDREQVAKTLGFLHAWRCHHPAKRPGLRSGAAWNPSKEQTEAYVREHREALLAIVDLVELV